jgi:hypothetical protein
MRGIIQVDPVFEDSGGFLMARIYGADNSLLQVADVSTLSLVVTQLGGVSGTPEVLTPSAHVFDVLQTDAIWTLDAIGYNFLYEFGPTQVPVGNKQVLFEFLFTPPSGPIFPVVFRVPVMNLLRS